MVDIAVPRSEAHMPLTLKQLRYADAVGRLGSIAAAAAELNISQSSITAAIDSLEAALGYDLFVRQPAKGVVPTPTGRRALAMVSEMLIQVSHFESELESLEGGPRGMLRLGAYVTAAPYILPPMLTAFSHRYPHARVDLREGDMATITNFLSEGAVDLACSYRTGIPDGWDFHPLFPARPYALISLEDQLSGQASVTLAELASRPVIMLELAYTREYFSSLFEAAGVRADIAHSTRSAEIVRALVAAGFGVSILNIRDPRASDQRAGYRCLPIADPVEAPEFGIAQLPNLRRPLMSRVFVELCESLRREGVFQSLTVPLPGETEPAD